MIDWLFIILFFVALLFMLIIVTRGYKELGIIWTTFLMLTSIIVFIVLSASIHEIEIPYQIYNASSGQIETGMHTIHTFQNTILSYFFLMFSVVLTIVYVAYILGPAIYKNWMHRKGL